MSMELPPPRLDLLVHSPSPESLEQVLSTLLEPSSTVPTLAASLQESFKESKPSSYEQLLDTAQSIVDKWDWETKATFVRSHPRIGETKNLSASSSVEQQNQDGASGDVLKRLLILNTLYEETFPDLRFVTFVNGRTRAQIVPEFEGILNLPLPEPSASTPNPSASALRQSGKLQYHPQGSAKWRQECERAIKATFDIAKDRVNKWQKQFGQN